MNIPRLPDEIILIILEIKRREWEKKKVLISYPLRRLYGGICCIDRWRFIYSKFWTLEDGAYRLVIRDEKPCWDKHFVTPKIRGTRRKKVHVYYTKFNSKRYCFIDGEWVVNCSYSYRINPRRFGAPVRIY